MASVERRERRQPDWSQAGIAHVETTDQDHRDTRPGGDALPRYLVEHLPQAEVTQLVDDPIIVQHWIEQQKRRHLLLTSSSHKVTAYVQEALEQSLGWGMKNRAILAFDHHSDMENIETGKTNIYVSKSNVMQYVLEHKLADAVAVLGTHPIFLERTPKDQRKHQYDIVSGRDLYSGEKPDKAKLLATLDEIFSQWQAQGIREVYVSVDLDGLRLPEQLYTGVDYYPLTKDPYYGLPASWIPTAMHHARTKYGLHLGVRNPRTGQQFVGDVVEYNLPDERQRTARIAKHILGAMLAEVQQDPIQRPT
ncbi:MAG: hypothetical protein ACD_41C00347G0002 [uncultured bacterium]|nr:MAG: hypothetical protein ACD_41C00347G0002 [uncultured bacterium]